MNIYQQIINKKLNTLSPEELVQYAQQYNIEISMEQAKKIIKLVKEKNGKVNVFNTSERLQLMKELSKITGHETAKKVNQLFMEFIK
ncbi:DUF2624 domain-containing protein [Sutcliffiella cohnii]|uniref:tRNA methyltransferase n=1 Tax=Sutcliffiella cohnii TaxID=33932 RepID=A0A223KTC1_9BACI|nr:MULTISPECIES: DUF2624 domain-containing protein [Sutcliffiella]AST92594.1 tRNA methyltransferase [Sutcliffiella cohnii]MED4019072.1 DUF2624 domain-containing protein [Sutcliffiella cohnii]WBL13834.1 DUF2624 domain-containing protein [Sutcliffiella sp. NC1]